MSSGDVLLQSLPSKPVNSLKGIIRSALIHLPITPLDTTSQFIWLMYANTDISDNAQIPNMDNYLLITDFFYLPFVGNLLWLLPDTNNNG